MVSRTPHQWDRKVVNGVSHDSLPQPSVQDGTASSREHSRPKGSLQQVWAELPRSQRRDAEKEGTNRCVQRLEQFTENRKARSPVFPKEIG